jgi:hypothetical protein
VLCRDARDELVAVSLSLTAKQQLTESEHEKPGGASGVRAREPAGLEYEAAFTQTMAEHEGLLSALVLPGADACKHAALRVASANDSLFSEDPFGIYRTSPFQTSLWEMLLSHRTVRRRARHACLMVCAS